MSYSGVGQVPTSFAVPAGPGGVFSGLGQMGGPWGWYTLWLGATGSRDSFTAWMWTDQNTATLLARRASGVWPSHPLYSSGGGPVGYGWREITTWFDVRHVSWAYTDSEGVGAISHALSSMAGILCREEDHCILVRDASGRRVT